MRSTTRRRGLAAAGDELRIPACRWDVGPAGCRLEAMSVSRRDIEPEMEYATPRLAAAGDGLLARGYQRPGGTWAGGPPPQALDARTTERPAAAGGGHTGSGQCRCPGGTWSQRRWCHGVGTRMLTCRSDVRSRRQRRGLAAAGDGVWGRALRGFFEARPPRLHSGSPNHRGTRDTDRSLRRHPGHRARLLLVTWRTVAVACAPVLMRHSSR